MEPEKTDLPDEEHETEVEAPEATATVVVTEDHGACEEKYAALLARFEALEAAQVKEEPPVTVAPMPEDVESPEPEAEPEPPKPVSKRKPPAQRFRREHREPRPARERRPYQLPYDFL